jgi:hypothetical protein
MVARNRNLTHSTAAFPLKEGSADNQFKWDTVCTHGEAEGGGGGLDTILMSMIPVGHRHLCQFVAIFFGGQRRKIMGYWLI